MSRPVIVNDVKVKVESELTFTEKLEDTSSSNTVGFTWLCLDTKMIYQRSALCLSSLSIIRVFGSTR